MAKEQPVPKEPAVIRVNKEWCKGCGICVAFCPKSVLIMSGHKVSVAQPDQCIKCMLCELRCPDFAITVE